MGDNMQLAKYSAIGALALLICGLASVAASATVPQVEFVDTGHRFGQFNTAGDLGDFDGDGDLDAFLGAYVAPATAWLNDGSGTFHDNGQDLELVVGQNVIVDEFDGNVGLDAFVVSHSVGTRLWHNHGSGLFASSPQSLGSSSSAGSAAGDLDNDGDVDLMLASTLGHINAIAFNDGSGSFTFGNNGPGLAARSIALGDLDNDGDLDAFLGQATSNGAAPDVVLFNNGQGVFSDSGQSLGNHFTREVALADFDSDGDLDAFAANSGAFGTDPTDQLWLNDGAGNFIDSGQQLGTAQAVDVELGDVDSDGDIDAIVVNSGNSDLIWLNNGAGVFADSYVLPLEINLANRILFGDVDGDRDGDLVVLAPAGNVVLENRTKIAPREFLGDTSLEGRVFAVPEPITFTCLWIFVLARFRGLAGASRKRHLCSGRTLSHRLA